MIVFCISVLCFVDMCKLFEQT